VDILPPRPPVEAAPTINTPQPSQASQHEPEVPAIPGFKTDPNSFAVYRIYKSGEPSFTPDDDFHIGKVSDGPNFNLVLVRVFSTILNCSFSLFVVILTVYY
jgi:hypothetical protein